MTGFLPAAERFLGLDDHQADPARAGFVVIPVPFERTSSYGRGSAAGPAAILAASQQVELYDADLGFEPWAAADGIATLSPLAVDDCAGGGALAPRLEHVVEHWLATGKRVVTLAGEHTGVIGAIRAHARRERPLTVLQLDAHSDLRPQYADDPWNHACTMARVLDFHRDIVQVAIRSQSAAEAALIETLGMPLFRCADIHRATERGADWIAPVLAACAENVYLTLDCDALDPSVIPATGTPEPGGLTWMQLDAFLARLCAERRLVGFDLSELAPIPELLYPQFAAAKIVHRLIGRMARRDRDATAAAPATLSNDE